jgi:hypothetical protein
MRVLNLPVAAFAVVLCTPVFAQDKPDRTSTPVIVSPELMRQNAALGVMQGHMNELLTRRDAVDVQINALQKRIDAGNAMAEKLAPPK